MRIGFFVDLFYPYMLGGIEQRCFELSKKFIELGNEVSVFTSSLVGSSSYEELFNGRLKIYRAGIIKNPQNKRNRWSLLSYLFSSYSFFKHVNSLDILDVNQYSCILGSIIRKTMNVPSVYTLHDFGGIRLRRGLSFLFLKSIQFNNKQPSVITVSNEVKRKLIRSLRYRHNEVNVVPNGVDFHRIRDDVKDHQKLNQNRILYVGRLVRYKQVDYLLRALTLLLSHGFEVSLDIIGMGEEFENLKNLASSMGLSDKVFFHGYLWDKTELFRKIAQADLFVNPSRSEGFGITLLEAMASGTPVVAFNLPCYHDFVVNGHNALLVQDMSHEKLAQAIELAMNKSLARKLRTQALKTAEKFDIGKVAKALKLIYLKEIENFY